MVFTMGKYCMWASIDDWWNAGCFWDKFLRQVQVSTFIFFLVFHSVLLFLCLLPTVKVISWQICRSIIRNNTFICDMVCLADWWLDKTFLIFYNHFISIFDLEFILRLYLIYLYLHSYVFRYVYVLIFSQNFIVGFIYYDILLLFLLQICGLLYVLSKLKFRTITPT